MKKKDGEIPQKALEIFSGAESVLHQDFNFYTFSVMTNSEQSKDIIAQTYVKELESQVVQLMSELNVKKNELESTRKMTKSFKLTEERSNKKINELQQRYDMVKEEKETQAEGFDKRLNTLIRNFVKEFNRIADNYLQYKDFVKHEIDILYLLIEEKNKAIEKKENDLGEYKMALRIPRQHYKHIEKLRFEEIMKQRDEIIIKLKKKYGIDPTK